MSWKVQGHADHIIMQHDEIHFFNILILTVCFKNPLWNFAKTHMSVWPAVKYRCAPLPQTFLKKIKRRVKISKYKYLNYC
jgi:hypothetical protein